MYQGFTEQKQQAADDSSSYKANRIFTAHVVRSSLSSKCDKLLHCHIRGLLNLSTAWAQNTLSVCSSVCLLLSSWVGSCAGSQVGGAKARLALTNGPGRNIAATPCRQTLLSLWSRPITVRLGFTACYKTLKLCMYQHPCTIATAAVATTACKCSCCYDSMQQQRWTLVDERPHPWACDAQ